MKEERYLVRHGVTLYLDVGANAGQTGQRLRQEGYAGRIASFEPIAAVFARLQAAADDPDWAVHHTGVGDRDGTATIGVSENFVSSSILPATDRLLAIHAPVRQARQEEISIARLDTVAPALIRPGDTVCLKIDTQGFERAVIEGAAGVLDRILLVRMEVAVHEVYAGEMTVAEAISLMADRGFGLIEAWPAWRHPDTAEVLHFDLFFRAGAPD
ncbi:FkbM family methyltransferase [Chachezhania sediminis]|uniref:FkbM family methyltransferase n=1 Tax=Chachezhania sediminis TaxID=2599291 RepID=UPI00131C1976|nr:FkbM family methyltransferase [Chachezhania sediminis]